jgi:hypothetical protein
MDIPEKLRRPQKKPIVIDQDQLLLGGDLPDERINLPDHPAGGIRPEGERISLGKGGDGGQEDPYPFSPAVGELPEKTDNLPHVVGEGVGRCVIAVHPDVVRAQLEKDKVRMLPRERRSLLFQIAQKFTRCVPLAAAVEDSCPPALPDEQAVEMPRILGVRKAVSGAEDDDSTGRRGTGAQKNDKKGKKADPPDLPPTPWPNSLASRMFRLKPSTSRRT